MNVLNDLDYLRRAVDISQRSRANGNTPFGALLVGSNGEILLEQGKYRNHRIQLHRPC